MLLQSTHPQPTCSAKPLKMLVTAIVLLISSIHLSLHALPANIEAERFLMAAKKNIEANDYIAADTYLNRLQALNIELPADYHYFKGKVALVNKNHRESLASFEAYVETAGRQGDYYLDALAAITETEKQIAKIQRETASEFKNNENKESQEFLFSSQTGSAQDKDQVYIDNIKALYLSEDAKNAVLMHINELLFTSPYTGSPILSPQPDKAIYYSIRLNQSGDIITSKNERSRNPANQTGKVFQSNLVSSYQFSVYGRDFFTPNLCSRQRSACWIKRVDSSEKWIEISYNPNIADEISRALSLLIKLIQASNSA